MTGDTRLEVLIGRVLRAGVVASSLCIACGLAVFLVAPNTGSAILNVGIVLLIATPGARVVLSIVAYTIERDWPFVALTTIVLAELAASVVAALVFHRRL
jgi:uncharacterized membrane protein